MEPSDQWVRTPLPQRRHEERGGVGSLAGRQMEVLRLRCVEEMTFAEIGERLGIAESTVKATMHIVLKKMGRTTTHGCCYDLCKEEYERVAITRPEHV